MASVAISALPAVVTPTTADVFPVVQGAVTKKLSMSLAFSIPPPIGGATPNTGRFTTMTAANVVSTSLITGIQVAITTLVGCPVFLLGTAGTEPIITSGAGVPGATQPKGSMYLRTGGGVGTTLYVSQGGGTWNAVAGV
jgi:hypothetical protein